MDQVNDKLNITFITFAGHVELQTYRFLYFTIMFIVYILVIVCNSTILFMVWIEKSLHEPMYIFIAALLLNSLFFSTNIYPKLLIDFLSDRQMASLFQCYIQSFIYYSLCGSEFLLLCVMAYDRYVSICKPLQYPTIMTKTTIRVLLGFAWFVPACQLVPSLFLSSSMEVCNLTLEGIYCNNSISQIYCVSSSAAYLIYGVFIILNTIIIPIIFIIFTYIKILIVAYQSSTNVRRKAVQTCSPHLLVLISFSCLSTYDVVIARLKIDLHKTTRFILTLQIVLYHPLFNPIVYGLKMKKISHHLKRFFFRGKLSVKADV
ncbi:olfactory receptor 6N2-like [Cololabis saira]|uniref:olfactory receptor 6N2-like n=1 Tax=Cololabis saira TaxID=129043 RepID=UPI002AD44D4F|nr:olfactory receptor 6N2-like [Cololabis saira]